MLTSIVQVWRSVDSLIANYNELFESSPKFNVLRWKFFAALANKRLSSEGQLAVANCPVARFRVKLLRNRSLEPDSFGLEVQRAYASE